MTKIKAWAAIGINDKIGMALFGESMAIYFTKKKAINAIRKNNGFKVVPCEIVIKEKRK